MKEIGEFLKSNRIKNGVNLEEAAEDLNLTAAEIENIENGNIRAFKDVYSLRELVKNYAKYLGIETDSIIDEFNDFMFEHTSKISLDDIIEAKKISKEKEITDEKNKISSPYTKIREPKFNFNKIKIKPIIITVAIIVIFILILIGLKIIHKDEIISSELMGQGGKEVYELTY